MKRISNRTFFCAAWLILGSLQMLATGCQSSAAATTGANPELPSQSAAGAAPASVERSQALPVRISRTFLEGERLKGELKAAEAVWDSQLAWNKKPTTLPEPQGEVLADFRDYEGCADFQRVDGLQLCFNVMPDVDSVGINEEEMQLKGAQQVLEARCDGQVSDVKYVSAEREAQGDEPEAGYKIRFAAQCAGAPMDLEVRLTRL